ncbi:mitochondrial inner membrane protein [Hysterangium stoloniferum]|nr:mitochondrial inner membrane protein [Hysterangium stoloniferum]
MAAVLVRSSILRRPLPRAWTAKITTRQATSSTATYVPGGPVLRGTVNDPTPFPPSSRSEGSHHWAFERLLSASLIPLTGAAFVTGSTHYPVLDGVLGIALVVHSHLGFDQIIVDYLDVRKFPVIGRIAKWGLRAATAGVLVGVYQFNTNDMGITELIRRVWDA